MIKTHITFEPYAMKVARTVLRGGKSERTYLSRLDTLVVQAENYECYRLDFYLVYKLKCKHSTSRVMWQRRNWNLCMKNCSVGSNPSLQGEFQTYIIERLFILPIYPNMCSAPSPPIRVEGKSKLLDKHWWGKG